MKSYVTLSLMILCLIACSNKDESAPAPNEETTIEEQVQESVEATEEAAQEALEEAQDVVVEVVPANTEGVVPGKACDDTDAIFTASEGAVEISGLDQLLVDSDQRYVLTQSIDTSVRTENNGYKSQRVVTQFGENPEVIDDATVVTMECQDSVDQLAATELPYSAEAIPATITARTGDVATVLNLTFTVKADASFEKNIAATPAQAFNISQKMGDPLAVEIAAEKAEKNNDRTVKYYKLADGSLEIRTLVITGVTSKDASIRKYVLK